MNTNDPRRPLTTLEKNLQDYVTRHPGLTAYDIAEVFGHTSDVYNAIPYLYLNDYVEHNSDTEVLTPRQV